MMENDRKISDDAKALADACSMHNRSSNKLWAVAATFTVLVIAADASTQNNMKLLGFDVNVDIFYTLSTFLIAAVNIAHCSSHVQAFRAAEIFNEYVMGNRDNANKFTRNYTMIDAYYCLISPGFTRMYPLTHTVPAKYRKYIYIVLKFGADLIFISTPMVGCVISICKSNMSFGLLVAALFCLVISMVSTILLLLMVFHWAFTREYAVTKQAADYSEPRITA